MQTKTKRLTESAMLIAIAVVLAAIVLPIRKETHLIWEENDD